MDLGTAELKQGTVNSRDLNKRGFLKNLFKTVKEAAIDVGDFVEDSIDAIQEVPNEIKDGIEKAAEEIKDGIEEAAKEIGDILKKIGHFDLKSQVYLGLTAGTEGKQSTIAADYAKYCASS